VDRFPFPLEETRKTPESLADVDMNVLSFASLGFPECCHRYVLGSQGDCGHSAEPMGARNDRILAVEGELASAICGCQSNVIEHFIDAHMQVEIRSTCGIAQFRLKSFSQCFTGCFSGFFGNLINCSSAHCVILFENLVIGLLTRIHLLHVCGTWRTRRVVQCAAGNSAYAMPVRLPSAISNVFLFDPSRLAL